MMNSNLDDSRAFAVVAWERGFTRAAARLRLSTSSPSYLSRGQRTAWVFGCCSGMADGSSLRRLERSFFQVALQNRRNAGHAGTLVVGTRLRWQRGFDSFH
jgi:hypothetical protein